MARRKIKYKNLLLFLIILVIIALMVVYIVSFRISNIYVNGNKYLSEQEIIENGKLENYPRMVFTLSRNVSKNILKSPFIKTVKVKKMFTKITIDVVENRPLFLYNGKTVLENGNEVDEVFNLPILVSKIDKDVYNDFVVKMGLINSDVLENISEITYTPNNVDNNLFLFSMNDGNYIYVNLDKFISVNQYFDIVTNFNNHKGILYLDSGEYFKILDN